MTKTGNKITIWNEHTVFILFPKCPTEVISMLTPYTLCLQVKEDNFFFTMPIVEGVGLVKNRTGNKITIWNEHTVFILFPKCPTEVISILAPTPFACQ